MNFTDLPIAFQIGIIKGGFALRFAHYVTTAVYALQVYDWLICFGDEYLYIHKARWTSVKFAYLFCRYFPLFFFPLVLWTWVGNHPISDCTKLVPTVGILVCLFTMSAQAVFIIRTCAFTGRNKFMFAFLAACWIALLASNLWINITKWKVLVEWAQMFGNSPCIQTDDPEAGKSGVRSKAFNANAVLMLSTFLFDSALTMIVFIHHVRFRTMWCSLGKAFVVYGMVAYVMVSALNLVMAIVLFRPDRQWDGLTVLHGPTHDIIACRLILMLRRRADPTSQLAKQSQIVRDGLRRMEASALVVIDDTESDHEQAIESWD